MCNNIKGDKTIKNTYISLPCLFNGLIYIHVCMCVYIYMGMKVRTTVQTRNLLFDQRSSHGRVYPSLLDRASRVNNSHILKKTFNFISRLLSARASSTEISYSINDFAHYYISYITHKRLCATENIQ